MAAEVKQDVLFNFISNTAQFIEGADRIVGGLDRMDKGMGRLEKGIGIINRAFSVFLGNLASDAFRAGVRGFQNLVGVIAKTEEVESRLTNLGLILKRGIGGPFWDSLLKIAAGTLDKLTSLFRDAEGNWTRPFYKLRAIAQTIGSWLLSLWQRLMGRLDEASQTWLDRLVSGIVAAVQKAAELLRRFATFVARIFGGRAPAEVTEAAVARVRAAPMARPEAVRPLVGEEEPEKAAKAARPIKPVAPPAAEDLKQMSILTGAWADMTKKLAVASAAAAKARTALAKAEDWLEKASEKVYDIRRKIQRLELDWAEIPERFLRGRRRQLALELQAAEHEEHERKKEVDAAQERFRAAEEYRREIERVTDALKRQIDTLAASIERQAEKYAAYLERLQEASQEQEELGKKVWDVFEGLEIPEEILAEVQDQLLPAFASIETSVASIVDSLGIAWEKAKGFAASAWEWAQKLLGWFDDLPDWAKTLFKTGILAIALNFITGGAAGAALKAALSMAFVAIGLGPTAWAIMAAGISISLLLVPALTPEVQEAWKKAWEMFTGGAKGWQAQVGKAAGVFLEHIPVVGPLLKNWADEFKKGHPDLIQAVRESLALPITEVAEEIWQFLFGGSAIPDLVNEILDWFGRLSSDLDTIVTAMTGDVVTQFDQLALGAGRVLDQLTAKFNLLSSAIRGIPPVPRDLLAFDSGQIKIITVNMQGSQFGAGVSEWEVKDWIFEAFSDVVRD